MCLLLLMVVVVVQRMGGNENERKEAKIVKFLQITNNTKSRKTFLRG